jgi:hypothetical protein
LVHVAHRISAEIKQAINRLEAQLEEAAKRRAADPRSFWFGREGTETKRFANEWFSSGAKWQPQGSDFKAIRKVLSRLSYMEAYEFIMLLLAKEVMSAETLGEILDTPQLREHLKERRAAIAALVPKVQKWIKAEEHKRH